MKANLRAETAGSVGSLACTAAALSVVWPLAGRSLRPDQSGRPSVGGGTQRREKHRGGEARTRERAMPAMFSADVLIWPARGPACAGGIGSEDVIGIRRPSVFFGVHLPSLLRSGRLCFRLSSRLADAPLPLHCTRLHNASYRVRRTFHYAGEREGRAATPSTATQREAAQPAQRSEQRGTAR